jgi:hypothetical protein
MQVAGSLPEQSQPSFVASIVTQKATGSDGPGLDQTLEAQAQSGLERHTELYTVGPDIWGAPRPQRAAQECWSLMSPAPASPRRPGVDRLLRRRLQHRYCSSTGLLPGRSPQRPL